MESSHGIGYFFKVINEKAVAELNAQLETCGLTCAQMDVLIYLLERRDRAVSMRDLERYFRLSHPTVTGLVRRLEKKGFLHCVVNPDDRRGRVLILTAKAEQAEKRMWQARRCMDARITAPLSADEARTLRDLLERVSEGLRENQA